MLLNYPDISFEDKTVSQLQRTQGHCSKEIVYN